MKAGNRRTPKLRFPEFKEEWGKYQVTKLGEIYIGLVTTMTSHYTDHGVLLIRNADISDGRFDFSDNPIYLDDEFAEQNASRRHKVGDVITVHTGDIGTSAVITEKEVGSLGFATIVTRPDRERIIPEYLCTFLNSSTHKNFAMNVSTGDGRNNYNLKDYYECVIPVPCLAEQRKIASLVIGLNKLILHLQQKNEWMKAYKQGILRKMFPQNGELVPEFRFPGFTDAWEQCKLGDICERVVRKNKNNESDLPLTIASQFGLIDQRDFFNKVVAAKDMSNYYLLKKGEFAYNKSYSNGFDYGSIKRLNAYEQGCLSTLYICFSLASEEVESDYLECYFDTLRWYEDVSQICSEGARNHGLLNVDTKAFFEDIAIVLPATKREQRQISGFLNNLDYLITLHQRKHEKMKEYKKGLLQQMFI